MNMGGRRGFLRGLLSTVAGVALFDRALPPAKSVSAAALQPAATAPVTNTSVARMTEAQSDIAAGIRAIRDAYRAVQSGTPALDDADREAVIADQPTRVELPSAPVMLEAPDPAFLADMQALIDTLDFTGASFEERLSAIQLLIDRRRTQNAECVR